MPRARKPRRLADAYTFPGFRPRATVQGLFGDPHARLITLVRRGKKRSAEPVARCTEAGTTARSVGFGTCPAASYRIYLELEVRRVQCRRCGEA